MTYCLSRRARLDILLIWNYIAEDNEQAADRFIDLLLQRFQLLGRNPHIGRRRDELRVGYRSFPVGQYLVFYRVMDTFIQIMHVVHGKRDVEVLFGLRVIFRRKLAPNKVAGLCGGPWCGIADSEERGRENHERDIFISWRTAFSIHRSEEQ